MFDDKFWNNIVAETNRYAIQIIDNSDMAKKSDKTWNPVSCNEMKVYLGLCIIMAQVKKPRIQMNWSKKAIIDTPIFRKTMPLKRFSQITRFFHFADNNACKIADKLRKVKPVIKYFNKKFQELYVMEEDIAIDESLMKFKGRLSYKQYNPSKRARYGIKFYKLCESASGYCYNFKIYSGKDKKIINQGASQAIVMELSKPILNKGHTIYLDNWFSSPKLYLTLVENKTNAVGTVRVNRANMPGDLVKSKIKKGDYMIRSCNGILAIKWMDRREVHFISTKHESIQMTEQNRKNREPILKPKCVIDYNQGMIGIDRHDQILASFPVMRKYLKGYRKIFFYMFDMALFNSYILYHKLNDTKQNYTDYRLQVAEIILQENPLEYPKKINAANADIPSRLHAKCWAHFPKHINPTPKKQHPTRCCRVCTKHKKRSETTWECEKCLVPLHVPDCFKKFHTLHNY